MNFDESLTTSTQNSMESFRSIKLEDLHQFALSPSHATTPRDLIRFVIFKKLWIFWGPQFVNNFKTCIETGVCPDNLKRRSYNSDT